MGRRILSNSVDRSAIEFISSNFLFFIFLFVVFILFIITFALMFAGVRSDWERRLGRALFFFLVPVYVWVVYFFWPKFSPLYWTLTVWFSCLLFMGLIWAWRKYREERMILRLNRWRCSHCKEINESVFLVCQKCKEPKNSG